MRRPKAGAIPRAIARCSATLGWPRHRRQHGRGTQASLGHIASGATPAGARSWRDLQRVTRDLDGLPSTSAVAEARGAQPKECLEIWMGFPVRGRRTCSRRTWAGASSTRREESSSGAEHTPLLVLERDGNLTRAFCCKRHRRRLEVAKMETHRTGGYHCSLLPPLVGSNASLDGD
jgi:hypothetical protein